MTSPSSIILEIPELLHIIGLNAERADLPSLALANKILNVGITILLYRDITLDRYRPTSRCMITLSTPPNRLAFGRDLASLVQVMDIRDPVIGRHLARSSRGSIAEMLAHAFPRMLNLRRLSSTMKLPRYTLILRILATTPFESLESFKFSPYYPVGEDGPAEKLQPFLPVLDTFQVDLRNIKVRFVVPVHEAILCSRAHCLRSLALLSVPNGLLSLLPAFPTLETLEVQASQLNFPCFRHANSVKSLILHDTFDRLDTPVEDLFPSLEEISCSALLIPVFLPPTSGRRRPIRTVRLRNATYEKFGDMSSFLPMSWSTDSPTMISQAIAHLQFSASAVTTLSFCMHDLHLAIEVLTELIPHLESIESLLLVLDGESVSCVRSMFSRLVLDTD